jgi:hypothetical protein
MNGGALQTLRGLKAGVAGQRVTITSVNGVGQVDLAHQNAGSAAANRLINFATSANTSLFGGSGTATYQYDATTQRWRLITHEQGDYIAVAYNAGDYTGNAAAWTVDAGDLQDYLYYLRGKQLFIIFAVNTTSVTAGSVRLLFKLPIGFTTPVATDSNPCWAADNNVPTTAFFQVAAAVSTTQVAILRTDLANWAAAVNLTAIQGQLVVQVN